MSTLYDKHLKSLDEKVQSGHGDIELAAKEAERISIEYAKQQCLEFAEWIGSKVILQEIEGEWFYDDSDDGGDNNTIAKNTEELFTEFLKSKQ